MVDLDQGGVHGEDAEGRLVESTAVLQEVIIVEIYYNVCAVRVV